MVTYDRGAIWGSYMCVAYYKRACLCSAVVMMWVSGAVAADFGTSQYRSKITFSGYTPPGGASTLTNFPALVILSTNIPGFSYSKFTAPFNGGDMRFAASDNMTDLNYEIDKWDTNGNSYVWVQVPGIQDNSAYMWLYFGSLTATNPPPCVTNGSTWSEGYVAVWHLNESGSLHFDSAGYSNTAVNVGSVAWSNGVIDGAQYTDGLSANYMRVTDHAELDGMTNLSLETLLYYIDNSTAQGLVSKRLALNNQDDYNLMIRGDVSDKLDFRANGDSNTLVNSIACPSNRW